MKKLNFRIIGVSMAFVFAAVGCVNEDPVYIEPGNPVTTETGYLTMSSIGLYVVSDSMTDQNTEHSPASMPTRGGSVATDHRTGTTRGQEASHEDGYIVTIMPKGASEPLFRDTYAALKTVMASNEKGMEVPVGMYDITATSNLTAAGAPADVQASPSYAGVVSGVSVAKDVPTKVETLVCKLQNIKITVGVAADLYEQFEVLDPDVDPTRKIEAKVYSDDKTNPVEWEIPADFDWTASEPKPVYFPVSADGSNTLRFSFRAKARDGRPITMNKGISGILKGQWRRIHVIPKYDTTGELTFDVTVSAFVQDETIIVGDKGAMVPMYWSELPYVDPDDPSMAAPSIRWADGSELPETITVGSTPTQEVIIAAPNVIERVALTFRSTNSEFAADVAAMTVEDLCTVPYTRPFRSYGIPLGDELKGQTAVSFGVDKILAQIRDYRGDYSFIFTVTDQAGFTCEQALNFTSAGDGNAVPQVIWESGTLFDNDGFNADGSEKPGVEYVKMRDGMEIDIKLAAEPNFEAIKVKITSPALTPDVLALAGLNTEFDLCNLQDFTYDGDLHTAADQANALKNNLGLIDKVDDELKAESEASFNITGFVSMMKLLGGGAKFQFALTVVDANGQSTTKYLRLQNPAE